MTQIRTRNWSEIDLDSVLPHLLDIEQATFNELGLIYSNEQWLKKHFLYELPLKQSLSLVLFVDETPVGFWVASLKSNSYIHTHRVAVDRKYRETSYSQVLIERFHTVAQKIVSGTPPFTLLVNTDNLRAIKFYQKFGYKLADKSFLKTFQPDFITSDNKIKVSKDYFCYLLIKEMP